MQIRRNTFLALGASGIGATLLAACGGKESAPAAGGSDAGGASDAGGKEGGAVKRADADLVIWADEMKAQSLEAAAKKWGEENGMTVAVQTVANDLQSTFVTANQAGNGPDMVLGAHDWLGNLVQNNAISAVQLPAAATGKIAEIAKKATTYEGQNYGVPYAVETLVLFSNKKLTDVPEPKSIEEMIEAGKAGGAANILSLPIGEEGDAYHMQPLYSSAGGYLFGTNAEGDADPADIGVGKEGSIAAGEKLKELGAQKVLKKTITNDNAIALFTEGKAAYLVSGPWALADIKKAKIDFGMTAVPGFEGMKPAQPFAGVNMFYVASKGKNAMNAQSFAQSIAEDTTVVEAMFEKNQLPPVNTDLQGKLSKDHPELIQVAQFAEKALPMPAIPAMAAIWKPLGLAEANIVAGADPKAAMESAGKQITEAI